MTKNKLKPLYTHYYDTAKYKINRQKQLRKVVEQNSIILPPWRLFDLPIVELQLSQ